MTLKRFSIWTIVLVLAGVTAFFPAEIRADYFEPAYKNPRFGDSDAVKDIIDIQRVEDGLIGVVEGRNVFRVDLGLNESISWRQTRGTVGAVLTEDRILAISEFSRGWVEMRLKLDESRKPGSITPLISDYLVMFVTGRRIVGFDSKRGSYVQQSIPIHDRVVSPYINSYVAALVTNNRIFGWARGRIGFAEIDIQENETIESVDTRPHTITVRTTRRVLIFRSERGGWRTFDAD